ncbi:MAG: HNH endonuclease [Chloroflexi bacterium]|nr:HNH endonuclease [Chloroflexota bacterium]
MPRRWATQTRYWVYRFLVLRDGESCQECGKSPTTRNGLDIDHIDGNSHNNEESNLRLLHRECNVARENRRRPRRPSVQGERENPRTRVLKQAIPYHEGSAEMQANFLFEVDYRIWLLQFVSQFGFITKKEAINAGAETVGCNPTTSAKYLAKLTSLAGPLMEKKDMLGDVVIIMKPQSNGNGKGNGHKSAALSESTILHKPAEKEEAPHA